MSIVADLHPNEIAQRLTGRDYISWSAITCYQACPLKYYWRYVRQLAPSGTTQWSWYKV